MSQQKLFEDSEQTVAPFSPAARRASPSHAQASGSDRRITAISGRNCFALSDWPDHVGLLAKTLLASSLWGSTMSQLIWKRKVTKLGRLYYQLWPSKRRICAIELSLWPTPAAAASKQGQNDADGKRGQTLVGAARGQQWATPTASMATIADMEQAAYAGSDPKRPTYQQAKNWNTPTRNDAKNATFPPAEASRDSVVSDIMALGGTGSLNPEFVEALQGYPIGWTEI